MSTLADLRTEIVNTIGDLLGTYTYPDGATGQAIYVGARVPEGVTVQGLEAVIAPDPQTDPMPMQGDVGGVREWTVVLRQHNQDDMTTLTTAVERLIARWPEMTTPVVIPATYETLAQARLSIPQRVLIKGR